MLNIGNSIIESLLGQVAGLGWLIQDFVVEDGEVKGKTESDWVGGLEVLVGDVRGLLVGIEGTGRDGLVAITSCVFGHVSVVVALHLQVEDLSFRVGGGGNEDVVEELEDVLAESFKFFFDLLLQCSEEWEILRSLGLFLLLNGADGSPGSSSGSNGVLESNGEEVSLFNAEFLAEAGNLLHVVKHVFESFGLLRELGEVDEFFTG